jgi:hypothetical protein
MFVLRLIAIKARIRSVAPGVTAIRTFLANYAVNPVASCRIGKMKKIKIATRIHSECGITPNAIRGIEHMRSPRSSSIETYIIVAKISTPDEHIGMLWIHDDGRLIGIMLIADHDILRPSGAYYQEENKKSD